MIVINTIMKGSRNIAAKTIINHVNACNPTIIVTTFFLLLNISTNDVLNNWENAENNRGNAKM